MKTFEKETFRESFIKVKLLGKASAKETFRESFIKAQSAMEYLMTYGWAILIIAVVLGALFELGVFNANNFAPKAPPGSCRVFRPNGTSTTSFINLEGICTGEIPQYVAQFNGQSSFISILKTASDTVSGNSITISVWIYQTGPGVNWPRILDGGAVNVQYTFTANAGGSNEILWRPETSGGSVSLNSAPLSDYKWYNIVATYNGSIAALYVYGSLVANAALTGTLNTGPAPLSIGGNQTEASWFAGSISNLQLYNTSLSANDIQALYQEGIGGAPIRLQDLVGWWPLNGNANDYSGNGNNGQINNVNFVSNWYSGYTPP